jgi:tRNA(Ile)-lysidine synthase
VKVELIRRCLAGINCGERYLAQEHYLSVLQLTERNVTGRKIELPDGFSVQREYGNLVFSNCRVRLASPILSGPAEDQAVTVEIPGQAAFEHFLIQATVLEKNEVDFEQFKADKTNSIEWFDLENIKPPLVIRHRWPGDRFVPLGQSEAKKLGKFLTAQRVPQRIRRGVLVVADRKKIIWVWPVRISEWSKITDQTQKIIQLQITDLNT